MTVSTGEPETPVEPSVVGLARHLRVALVYGRDARHRVLLSRIALAASLDAVLAVAADDRGSLVEIAQAFRDASPDAVLIACDGRDVRRVAVALEALRLGCAFQRPRPTVHVVADARVGERLRPAANPFVLDVHADATAALVALRALRRSAQPDAALRDELVEDAARALVASTGSSGLVVDVTETTTSCVLARAVGGIESVHLTRAGIGASVDRILAEVGADGVRRWLPWPIDAPALLERIYNRARWPGALPASELALAIEMAVARETIAAAVRAAERASIDVSELRAAPNMLVTGRAAGFPRPAETLLVLVDGLQPTGVVTVWREPDDGRAERLGLVVTVWGRRAAKLAAVAASRRRTTAGPRPVAPKRGCVPREAPVVGWRYATWSADHPLPIGRVERAPVGDRVNAGDVIAAGLMLATPTRLSGARRLGLEPDDLDRVLRVPVGAEIPARTVIARTGRRFARAVTAPHDGRVLQITADGDLYLAPVVGRWVIRSTLDGSVTRSDDAVVTVEGSAWGLGGFAAYGPDAVGELLLAVDSPSGELSPGRLDVRIGGRIVIGGARVSAEALTRAHACGIAGIVGGAVPAAGLRVVYDDGALIGGFATREDRPTVLSLIGFGAAALPRELFGPLKALAGSRAAIHTATARLFVFAPSDAIETATTAPSIAIAADYGGVRVVTADCAAAGEAEFASGVRAQAVRCADEVFPAANVRRVDEPR
ncbi:MAG: hypothetical protein E6I28_04670 [Chloroflexi bacterium]|nr:MAG: hypothetical protein E6I28_04670 [Chloroflexota bacterium]